MNEQAAKLSRWLLAGNGALKNIARLAVTAFEPNPVAALTVAATTITAYPVSPEAEPHGRSWTRGADSWTHPLHSQLLPRSNSADHYVLVGVTSRNELLMVNLAAAGYVGIEGENPLPMMRSWMIQALAKTPTAVVAVTSPELAIPATDRLLIADSALDPPPAAATLLFGTDHTPAPTTPTPTVISAQAADAANVVLCNNLVAGIYLANRYWPLWRRMELDDSRWKNLHGVLAPKTPIVPATETEEPAPAPAAAVTPAPAGDEKPPALEVPSQPAPVAPPSSTEVAPASATDITPVLPAAAPSSSDKPAAPADRAETLPGSPPIEQPQPGLYVLGETYVLGVDPDTGEQVKHSAITRQGVRKPVKALMALATSSGITQAEWEEAILRVTPQNRRQLRTQIRKMMGGRDPIRPDARGLLVTEVFCDWKEFNRLAGHRPETATTEDLTAAVSLIRGAPFADVPDADYSWRSVQLLKDDLIDKCSGAAMELAQRQQAAGATEQAHQTARLGLQVYTQREDLWVIAAETVTRADRPGLIWDLKHAIPVPTRRELRELLDTARAS